MAGNGCISTSQVWTKITIRSYAWSFAIQIQIQAVRMRSKKPFCTNRKFYFLFQLLKLRKICGKNWWKHLTNSLNVSIEFPWNHVPEKLFLLAFYLRHFEVSCASIQQWDYFLSICRIFLILLTNLDPISALKVQYTESCK